MQNISVKNNLLNLTIFFTFFIYITVFTREICPDFNVFYWASKRLFNGENLYLSNNPLTPYNFPVTYLLFYPFTFFKPHFASNLFLFVNLLSVLAIWKIVIKEVNIPEFGRNPFLLFILLHFSSRSILNNGQVGFIYILLIVSSFSLVNSSKKSLNLVASILLTLSFNLKPYLFILTFVWLFCAKKINIVIYIIATEILFLFICYNINKSANILSYLQVVQRRVGTLKSEPDQISILNILQKSIGFSANLAICIFVVQILIVLYYLTRVQFQNSFVSFIHFASASILISPYFHRQDAILFGILFYIVLSAVYSPNSKNDLSTSTINKLNILIILPFIAHTGGSRLTSLVYVELLLLVFINYFRINWFQKILILLGTLFVNLILYFTYMISWEKSYSIWTVLVYFSTLLSFISNHYFIKNVKNRIQS